MENIVEPRMTAGGDNEDVKPKLTVNIDYEGQSTCASLLFWFGGAERQLLATVSLYSQAETSYTIFQSISGSRSEFFL